MALSCVSKDRISWCLCSPSLTRCPHCSSELATFDFRLSISVSASRRASAKVNFSAWKIVKLVSHWLLQHLACDMKSRVIFLQLFNWNLLDSNWKCRFVWRKMFGCSNVIFFCQCSGNATGLFANLLLSNFLGLSNYMGPKFDPTPIWRLIWWGQESVPPSPRSLVFSYSRKSHYPVGKYQNS